MQQGDGFMFWRSVTTFQSPPRLQFVYLEVEKRRLFISAKPWDAWGLIRSNATQCLRSLIPTQRPDGAFFFFGRGHRNIIKCTFHLVESAAPKWRALPPDDVQKAKGGESSELFVLIAANIQDLEGRCDAETLKVALSSPLNVPEEMNAFIKKKKGILLLHFLDIYSTVHE